MSEQASFFSSDDLRVQLEGALLRNVALTERNQHLEGENLWLKEQLASLKREKFGKKSERWESQEQRCLFNEAEVESQKPEADDQGEELEVSVAAHTKKRGYRRPLPESLPREIVKIELPLEEQKSEDGTALKIIGWETSEKLKYEPAKMSVIEYQRAKYGVDSGDYVKTAPPVPSIIPKGLATPELRKNSAEHG